MMTPREDTRREYNTLKLILWSLDNHEKLYPWWWGSKVCVNTMGLVYAAWT